MKINKNAQGIIKKQDGKEIAYAISNDGRTIEFKIKCKAKDLQAQDIVFLS